MFGNFGTVALLTCTICVVQLEGCMGFNEAKKLVIDNLIRGNFSHELRSDIDIKNVLATGCISVEQSVEILKRSRGDGYSSSPHVYDSSIEVHVIKTKDWYIKWYFTEPDCMFISFHNHD